MGSAKSKSRISLEGSSVSLDPSLSNPSNPNPSHPPRAEGSHNLNNPQQPRRPEIPQTQIIQNQSADKPPPLEPRIPEFPENALSNDDSDTELEMSGLDQSSGDMPELKRKPSTNHKNGSLSPSLPSPPQSTMDHEANSHPPPALKELGSQMTLDSHGYGASEISHGFEDRGMRYLPPAQVENMMRLYAMRIFRKADMDGDGFLDFVEFSTLVQSRTLGLDISDEEVKAMQFLASSRRDGLVSFIEFIPVLQTLLHKHALRKKNNCDESDNSWKWFGMYFDEDPDTLPVYYDVVEKQMTYDKPQEVVQREIESQKFEEAIWIEDGSTLMTYVDENGVRLYLDFETGIFEVFPDEWISKVKFAHGDAEESPADDWDDIFSSAIHTEKFTHPDTGIEYESIFEDGVRKFLDKDRGNWMPIPISLEIYVPVVAQALRLINDRLPMWFNTSEKVLSLRANSYSVDATVAWKKYELKFPLDEEEKEFKARASRKFTFPILEETTTEEVDNPYELIADSIEADESLIGPSPTPASSEAADTTHRKLNAALSEDHPLVEDLKKANAELREINAKSILKIKELTHQLAEAGSQLDEISRKHLEPVIVERVVHVPTPTPDPATVSENEMLKVEIELVRSQQGGLGSQLDAFKNLIASQEEQIKNLSLEAEENLTNKTEISHLRQQLASHQQTLAALEQEAAALREGSDWKQLIEAKIAIIEEREKTIESLQNQISELTKNLLSQKHLVRTLGARVMNEISSLKASRAALRQFTEDDLVQTMTMTLKDTSQRINSTFVRAIDLATQDLLARYRYESRQRKLLYNKLQELKGNIRVFCRVRYDSRVSCALAFPDAHRLGTPTEIMCPNPKDAKERKKFEFDRVYNPDSTQEEVFEDTEPIITSCVDGYNVCILAYGQTGSGKTFTMMGTDENMGVNRRAIRELLKICSERNESEFELSVSLLEIYNEKIIDLLAGGKANLESECEIRLDPKTKQVVVGGLTVRPVKAIEDVLQVFAEGDANRSVASTKMNSTSSRSHLLFQVTVSGFNKVSGVHSVGKLTLVDLAGSERISKTEATGQRLVEAASINKSLSALGQVFSALRMGQAHIPYRNSKLTHILQDSLGGDSKTCLFVNVSPAESNLSETLGTLKFGSAIRTIELGPSTKQPAASS